MTDGKHHLEVDQTGPAKHLEVGDRFIFVDGRDPNEHEITQDRGSHLEFDGRVNRRLSKDVMVKRVGEHNPGERTERAVAALTNAVKELERSGDVQQWSVTMSDVISRVAVSGMNDAILPLEKLAKQGAAVFSKTHQAHGKSAVDGLVPAVRKRWAADVAATTQVIRGSLLEGVRMLVREVIQRCGNDWCLYTAHKKNGKRRRLGTHSSRADAERQERAIKANGG